MAKNDNQNDVEDYLAQVEWEQQQAQRRIPLPWYMWPKWKYKKTSSQSSASTSLYIKILQVISFLILGSILYMANTNFLILWLFFGIFFLLMILDASKKTKDGD